MSLFLRFNAGLEDDFYGFPDLTSVHVSGGGSRAENLRFPPAIKRNGTTSGNNSPHLSELYE